MSQSCRRAVGSRTVLGVLPQPSKPARCRRRVTALEPISYDVRLNWGKLHINRSAATAGRVAFSDQGLGNCQIYNHWRHGTEGPKSLIFGPWASQTVGKATISCTVADTGAMVSISHRKPQGASYREHHRPGADRQLCQPDREQGRAA